MVLYSFSSTNFNCHRDRNCDNSTESIIEKIRSIYYLLEKIVMSSYNLLQYFVHFCLPTRYMCWNTSCNIFVLFCFYISQLILISFQIIVCVPVDVGILLWAFSVFVYLCCITICKTIWHMIKGILSITILPMWKAYVRPFQQLLILSLRRLHNRQ